MTVSGTHARSAATMSVMSVEKRILTEFLQMYREFPCLWDNRQVLYINKEARDQAYEVLLEKYKRVQEDATVMDVKKKIENMRCAYRREHKKVLLSRINGDVDEYSPTLWYYDLLVFLNDVSDFSRLESVPRENDDSFKIEFDEAAPPKVKKRKTSMVSTIYLPEQPESDEDDNDNHDGLSLNPQNENSSPAPIPVNTVVTEAQAFGTTIGLQLKELDPMQRVIAEKIISDVIFNARLNKLTVNSTVVLNDKSDDSF